METLATFDIVADATNCRHSEGSFVTLKNGRLLYIYTRYLAGRGGDNDSADLACCFSDDGGMTWQMGDVLVRHEEEDMNIMSVSLLRLTDGRILMLYLRKRHAADGSVYCMPFCRWSSDEAQSWSEPVSCLQPDGYHVVNNDRLVQLSSGRIAFAMSYHWNGRRTHNPAFAIYCYSDDGGATWQQSPNPVFPSMESGTVVGWQEPGIVELAPHELMMWLRTDLGYQYLTFSHDDGQSWSNPRPGLPFRSPTAPMSLKRDPTDNSLIAIWDDQRPLWGNTFERYAQMSDRRPLVIARSRDNGKTWGEHQLLENEPGHGYCYIAIHFHEGKLLLGYCCGFHGNGHSCLMDTRIRVLKNF
ncbi:MAG: exo-alpha-sialidase [Victivallales bacterium]|nr:exo-alpha-sialidase [Victivallales bacterium]